MIWLCRKENWVLTNSFFQELAFIASCLPYSIWRQDSQHSICFFPSFNGWNRATYFMSIYTCTHIYVYEYVICKYICIYIYIYIIYIHTCYIYKYIYIYIIYPYVFIYIYILHIQLYNIWNIWYIQYIIT